MPGYQVRIQQVEIGRREYRIQSLRDRDQFSDPEGLATKRGIDEASWSLFGQLWPSGICLAEAMDTFDLGQRRVLEIGSGLALPSIVAHAHGADITVSDYHPLGARFLAENLTLNGLSTLPFHEIDWVRSQESLGRFDVIIGSDILYERNHPLQLVRFIERHATLPVEVLIADPGRRQHGKFTALMGDLGFQHHETRPAVDRRIRLKRYVR